MKTLIRYMTHAFGFGFGAFMLCKGIGIHLTSLHALEVGIGLTFLISEAVAICREDA
jgi:hypothetical protein